MRPTFSASPLVERRYAVAIRKVSRIVAGIIKAHIDGHEIIRPQELTRLLLGYSESLGPFAKRLSETMVSGIAKHNEQAWAARSKAIGLSLRQTWRQQSIGHVAALIQHRQVELITSIPPKAGIWAQELARQAQQDGTRAAEVAEHLQQIEDVTLSRATLIARTEVAKANAAITQARAESVGATSYIWETAEDDDVRDSHREMQGTKQLFAEPPLLSDGMVAGPGETPNCRCFAVPELALD
jgi:SPP1 gp7 family putative phage head morphogenesis protein